MLTRCYRYALSPAQEAAFAHAGREARRYWNALVAAQRYAEREIEAGRAIATEPMENERAMNGQVAEQQVFRTTTVGQLVAALVECRDQTDICYFFENHQGGTLGFAIAFQRLGISKADWDHANSEGGFYALVWIVAEKLGLPRYEIARRRNRKA